MKTNFKHLLVVLGLILPLTMFAESKKIEQKEFSKKQTFLYDDATGPIYDYVPVTVSGYYDDDDKFIFHGPVTSVYSETASLYNGAKATFSYNAKGKFIEGKLEGPLSIEISGKTVRGNENATMKLTLSANYVEGIADGKWIIKEFETYNSKTIRNYTTTVVYDKGKIISYIDEDGSKAELTANGFSGKYDDKVYKNGINTEGFYRKTGEFTKFDDKTRTIYDDLQSGKISKNDLLDMGYVLHGWVYEVRRAPKNWFFYLYQTYFDLRSEFAWGEFKYETYEYDIPTWNSFVGTLKRVDLLSWEELKKNYLDEIDFSKFNFNQNSFYDEYSKTRKYRSINFQLQENQLVVNYNDSYYYNNEVKEKIVSFLNEEQLKKIQAEEEQRKREEEERLAKIKENVSGALNKLVKVSNVKEMKFWGVDVVLGADFTSNPQDWSNFSVTKELLVERLSPFCPILNYEILDMENINENLIVKCNLNKFIGKKAGYETYQTEIFVDTYGKVDMSKSFNFKQAVKVENDWDKIRRLNSQIDANKAKITGEKDKFLSDVVSTYTKYHKSYNFEVGDNTGDCVSRLESFVKIQNQCFEFIELRKKINVNDIAILGNGTTNKNIVKLYVSYFKTLDLVWSSDEKAKDKLNDVIATQDRLIQILSSEYASLLEVAVVEEKIVNLQSVFDCFETIDLRKQRNENNDAIMAQAKQCKNIVKIYAAYFKKLDFTWTSADASKAKFEEVITNQEVIRKAIESANAAELDNAIKKEKIKDIQALVNRLK